MRQRAVIGCDWNKDGKIDDQDYYMFKLIFGTHQVRPGISAMWI